MAALEGQLTFALLADMAHPCEPCDHLLAVQVAPLPEELHAPSPVALVAIAAHQQIQ